MPLAAMESLAAGAAGQALAPPAVGGAQAAAGAAGDPAGRLNRHGKAMAQAHLKHRLAAIDVGHAGLEVGAMHLPGPQHPVHPGMDHLVAEGAEQGLAGQGLQQRPRQHDLTEVGAIGAAAAAIQTGGAGEPTIAPAQVDQGAAPKGQLTGEVLPVEPMEQGWQRFQGHGGAPREQAAGAGPAERGPRDGGPGSIATAGRGRRSDSRARNP